MNDKKFCIDSYKYFSDKEGNQHIASLYALEKIIDIVNINKPKRILEIGLGIGSIAYTVMKYTEVSALNMTYEGTEANEFCLNAIKENLGKYSKDIKVYQSLDELKPSKKYDLVIIDGSDDSLKKVKDIISEHGVIFIEGCRALQLETINNLFPKHKYASCVADYKNPDFGPFPSKNWSGGGQLIYINPNLLQAKHYVKERVKTSFTYKFTRKFYTERKII
ncbi:hypothetical protein [Winogradskyella forsetii]|uniref:hypothetical protein n=1 Tax=Winogradskyella forsetii TaxID=2686077 RepID=UPI0015BE6C6E|nr:hypothetical protein [Winogradskyella forsetii]